MSKILKFPYRGGDISNSEKIKEFEQALSGFSVERIRKLGFQTCLQNTQSFRNFCPKCSQGKDRARSREFDHLNATANHINNDIHDCNKLEFPPRSLSIKFLDFLSFSLQLRMMK